MTYLHQVGPTNFDPLAVPVVALAHNEANILNDFLEHYRSLGSVTFLVVDDRSTDATPELLSNAPDVTVFRPSEGSSYKEHKALWRSELLDTFGNGRWCVVPDFDEHLVFLGAQTLLEYIGQLDREGAAAVATLMIDMYADLPLKAHVHTSDSDIPLRKRFSLFDGPDAYVMRPVTGGITKNYPTPPIRFHGGPRHRCHHGRLLADTNILVRHLLRTYLSLDRPVSSSGSVFQRQIPGRIARHYFSGALNMTKLGLVHWRKGMKFNGGAHKLNKAVPMSESIAGFLHYPFTKGETGILYNSNRGQHAGLGKHYRAFLDADVLEQSFVSSHTKSYRAPSDLKGLIRPVPKAQN